MRGEFLPVWPETWRELWSPLMGQDRAPIDLVCELYREIAPALKTKPSVEVVAGIIDDPAVARVAFEKITVDDLVGERALTGFFETAHAALDDLAGDSLSNPYFNLLESFIDKFSLRYDLRRPCTLCPTISGMFASLVRDLRETAKVDAHLDKLMKDFETAVRDLRGDSSEGRIKTCIQKQMNFMEALGRANPGMVATTLGAIGDELRTWPHEEVKKAMKSLYKFSCDYPGIRHGGTPASRLRDIEMRDMVAISALLVGFTPYVDTQMQCDAVYHGS